MVLEGNTVFSVWQASTLKIAGCLHFTHLRSSMLGSFILSFSLDMASFGVELRMYMPFQL
jgi:hypothetical protein